LYIFVIERGDIEREICWTNTILMENNNIKNKQEELNKNIKDSEKALKELRKNCKHSETNIKDVNTESSALKLMKVCNLCGEQLGFPTNQELKDNGYMPK